MVQLIITRLSPLEQLSTANASHATELISEYPLQSTENKFLLCLHPATPQQTAQQDRLLRSG